MEYTRKTIELINNAYSHFYYIAECTSYSYRHELDKALKYETKERKSVHTAKALIMRIALEFFDAKQLPDILESAGISTGIFVGALNGCAAMIQYSTFDPPFSAARFNQTLKLMREATDAQHNEVLNSL